MVVYACSFYCCTGEGYEDDGELAEEEQRETNYNLCHECRRDVLQPEDRSIDLIISVIKRFFRNCKVMQNMRGSLRLYIGRLSVITCKTILRFYSTIHIYIYIVLLHSNVNLS